MNTDEKTAQISPWWGLLVIFALGFPSFHLLREPIKNLENYGQIPAFSMTDQEGRAQRNMNYLGQTVVLNFIFTRCKDVCPTLSSQMSRIQTSYQRSLQRDQLQLLSISVDPYYDSPEVLREYGYLFSTNSEHWHFLTGEKENLPLLIQQFQQAYEITSTESDIPSIVHSEKFILIDPEGYIRGFFSNTEDGRQELFNAINLL